MSSRGRAACGPAQHLRPVLPEEQTGHGSEDRMLPPWGTAAARATAVRTLPGTRRGVTAQAAPRPRGLCARNCAAEKARACGTW